MEHVELRALIASVNKEFYDRIYKDPWLSQVFRGVAQEHIERQQTDFMVGAFGGPRQYAGRSPADAHPHIFIDEEMWELRERLPAFSRTMSFDVYAKKMSTCMFLKGRPSHCIMKYVWSGSRGILPAPPLSWFGPIGSRAYSSEARPAS